MATFHVEPAGKRPAHDEDWVPDARNFAYLNWKQVDALPRASTLLVLPRRPSNSTVIICHWRPTR